MSHGRSSTGWSSREGRDGVQFWCHIQHMPGFQEGSAEFFFFFLNERNFSEDLDGPGFLKPSITSHLPDFTISTCPLNCHLPATFFTLKTSTCFSLLRSKTPWDLLDLAAGYVVITHIPTNMTVKVAYPFTTPVPLMDPLPKTKLSLKMRKSLPGVSGHSALGAGAPS